jgi:hypothetical protein
MHNKTVCFTLFSIPNPFSTFLCQCISVSFFPRQKKETKERRPALPTQGLIPTTSGGFIREGLDESFSLQW